MVRVDTGKVVETSTGAAHRIPARLGANPARAGARARGLREGDQAPSASPARTPTALRKEDNVVSLPRNLFPAEVKLEKGLCLYARRAAQSYPITVREVKEDMVVVDLNHPLAGERLFFEVNIRGVRPAGNMEMFTGKARAGRSRLKRRPRDASAQMSRRSLAAAPRNAKPFEPPLRLKRASGGASLPKSR